MSRILTVAAFAGASLMAAPAAEPVLEANEIRKLAKEARTPADHAAVAKHYRMRAESLEAEADKLEREVREQKAAPPSPMQTKWPAMVVNARERKERIAMQARRAAQESSALAERHGRLAGEAGEVASGASQ